MNYNKHKFTVKEFLALPVYDEARTADIGEVFLLAGKFSAQQGYLNQLIAEHTEAGLIKQIADETAKNPRQDHRIKVNFWKILKDGHVGEFGGTIEFLEEGVTLKGDKVVLNFGDDMLKISDEAMGIKSEPTLPIGG